MPNEGQDDGSEMEILRLDSDTWHAIGTSVVVLLIALAAFYNKDPTEFMAFHAPSLYRSGEQFPQKLYELHDRLDDLSKIKFLLDNESEAG